MNNTSAALFDKLRKITDDIHQLEEVLAAVDGNGMTLIELARAWMLFNDTIAALRKQVV